MNPKHLSVALLAICLLRHSASGEEAGSVVQDSGFVSQSPQASTRGESEIIAAAKHASESSTGLQFDENYKTLLSGESSGNLEILNDSSEVVDDEREKSASKFDEFSLPENNKTVATKSGVELVENVYKVPKAKTKKVNKSKMGAFLGQERKTAVNDFNHESFSRLIANESSTTTKSFFHAFTNLFDHYAWSTDPLTGISKACFEDITDYLAALKEAKDWALKVSDASGRYRGLYFFENGKKIFNNNIYDWQMSVGWEMAFLLHNGNGIVSMR